MYVIDAKWEGGEIIVDRVEFLCQELELGLCRCGGIEFCELLWVVAEGSKAEY